MTVELIISSPDVGCQSILTSYLSSFMKYNVYLIVKIFYARNVKQHLMKISAKDVGLQKDM